MDNHLKAVGEMWDFFDSKSTQVDIASCDYDNGQKDKKSDYKTKKLELIDETIKELEQMKIELKQMENTLENKANFFAQYIIAEPQVWTSNSAGYLNVDTYHLNVRFGFEKRYLILTPLSQITDEHALEVAKMLRYPKVKSNLHLLEMVKRDLHSYFNFTNRNVPLKVSDYLRSKRYALPWMGLSVDKLISFGWIMLKEVE